MFIFNQNIKKYKKIKVCKWLKEAIFNIIYLSSSEIMEKELVDMKNSLNKKRRLIWGLR